MWRESDNLEITLKPLLYQTKSLKSEHHLGPVLQPYSLAGGSRWPQAGVEEKGAEGVTRISSPGGGTWTSSQDTSLSAESLQYCTLGFDRKVWKLKYWKASI